MSELPRGLTIQGLTIRAMTTGDVPAVLRLERETPAAPHWSEAAYAACAGEQTGNLRHFGIVAERAGELAGFAVVRHLVVEGRGGLPAENECELESIVVAVDLRRRGIAGRLLETAIAEGAARRAGRMTLEVRESNLAAMGLYHLAGFVAEGRRAAYYVEPVEDAVLMSVTLNGQESFM
jgi:ribosomal protein S18 acetylase RimI-like enzyme